MLGARDNTVISLDHLSANIICHPWLNFQCWLMQRDLKSVTDIMYMKLKKGRDNSWKIRRLKYCNKARDVASQHDDIYYISLQKQGKNFFQSLKNWSFLEKIRSSEYALKIRVTPKKSEYYLAVMHIQCTNYNSLHKKGGGQTILTPAKYNHNCTKRIYCHIDDFLRCF